MDIKLNLHQDANITLIHSYSDGKVWVDNTLYTDNLIVTPAGIFKWSLREPTALSTQDFEPLFELDLAVELVILGTGKILTFPSADQTRLLIERQIGIEVMDTSAACRTYNILAGDGRKVAACLMV